jgi:hypothetical protein
LKSITPSGAGIFSAVFGEFALPEAASSNRIALLTPRPRLWISPALNSRHVLTNRQRMLRKSQKPPGSELPACDHDNHPENQRAKHAGAARVKLIR